MMEELGYYVTCDDAVCADCFEPDTWDGPLPIFGWDEGDTPTHCAVCESLIPHALTSDGIAYVRAAFAEASANMGGRRCIVRAWAEEYLRDDAEALETVADWPTSDDYSPEGAKDRRARV